MRSGSSPRPAPAARSGRPARAGAPGGRLPASTASWIRTRSRACGRGRCPARRREGRGGGLAHAPTIGRACDRHHTRPRSAPRSAGAPPAHRGERGATRCNPVARPPSGLCCSPAAADAGGATHDPDPRHARPPTRAAAPTARTRGSPTSRRRCAPATSSAPPACSPPPASGATWSPSPGTSPPSRTATASPTCSPRRSTAPTRPGFARRGAPRRGRRRHHRVVHLRDRGRPRARAGCGSSRRTASRGLDLPDHALRAEGPRGAARHRPGRWAPSTAPTKHRLTWLERAQQEEAEPRHHASSPTCWSSAAARAASRSAPGCASSACRRWSSTSTSGPGDQWRGRYKSLCLHDPVWYDHLPYLKFPENWPVFSPKDKIGDWLESYTKVMEVPYWSSTTATSASYSEETGEWTVEVERDGNAAHPAAEAARAGHRDVGQAEHPRAARPGRLPRRPAPLLGATPGRTPTAARRCVVIGCNNSAFDICGALWENDADVTMVQRSLDAHRQERTRSWTSASATSTPSRRWRPA